MGFCRVAALGLFISCVGGAQTPSARIVRPSTIGETVQPADPAELHQQARDLLDSGHYEEAIKTLDEVLRLKPNNGEAFADRALGYAHTNRLVEASRDLVSAERLLRRNAVLHRVRALIAMRRSDDHAALGELSKSLQLEPGNPFALEHRAWMYHEMRQESAALADADAYIAAHPDHAEAYVLRANLLRAQGKAALASAEADRLLQLFPDDPHAIASAARVHAALGERNRAISTVSKAIELNPDLSYFLLLRARFRERQDLAGRRADLEAALKLDPASAAVVTHLGQLAFDSGAWGEAVDRFSWVLKREPKDFGVLAYRAAAHLKAGNRLAADQDYSAAMEAASGADDLSLICRVFARENLALEWALAACNRAAELKPASAYALAHRALAKLRREELRPALADYDAAIAADDRRADAYYGRSVVHWRLGNKAGAEADRIKAMALDPNVADEFRELGFQDF